MSDLLSLDELADYPVQDPEVVTEADIDEGYALIMAEMDAADDEAYEARREVDDCCGGRNWYCSHWRGGY